MTRLTSRSARRAAMSSKLMRGRARRVAARGVCTRVTPRSLPVRGPLRTAGALRPMSEHRRIAGGPTSAADEHSRGEHDSLIRWRGGTVVDVRREWDGVREVGVDVPGDGTVAALAYIALVGVPEPGDRALLNTTALAMGLGTGGHALVVALPDRLPSDPSGPGHLVKARYTPAQATVLGVDEPDSP